MIKLLRTDSENKDFIKLVKFLDTYLAEQDEEEHSFYKGIVSLERKYIGPDPDKNPVLPGMTIQADVKTGNKTVMEYLLKPIFTSAGQALRPVAQ